MRNRRITLWLFAICAGAAFVVGVAGFFSGHTREGGQDLFCSLVMFVLWMRLYLTAQKNGTADQQ
ncbi:MAG TPA: hypothetical protein VND64_20030 [Pirellulales bacterium]|nr:hypothetical protein [Pirellulales bacterium]